MEVILIEEVPNLGTVGSLVKVKPGYGRNFLFPRQLAIPASSRNKARLQHEQRIAEFRRTKWVAAAQAAAKQLHELQVTIERKVGEQDKLFGSVTTHDIEEALSGRGIKVPKRSIHLDEPIRALGVYDIEVKLTAEVRASFKLYVIAES